MKKVNKAVILAAGRGTRFLPITKGIPKGMITIMDKPVLHYVAAEIVKSEISDIAIVVSSVDKSIENYFSNNLELVSIFEKRIEKLQDEKNDKELLTAKSTLEDMRMFCNAKFTYIVQKSPKGSGDAVLCVEDFTNNEPFALLNGDDIIISEIPCVKQLTDQYDNYNASIIGCQRVDINEIVKYGSVKYKEQNSKTYKVEEIIEKPKVDLAPSNLASLGRYVVKNEIFKYLKTQSAATNGEIQFTDSLNRMAQDYTSYAYDFDGTRYDAGDKLGYLKAVVDFALASGYKKDFKDYLEKILQERH
ncbi:MAG: UTP--glucose-1-phosphate uridylyltransferase [Firmicutes bacterium]|nr:UTP--glucose-1-phosphate uridylyltransferase [Bacillota bacterium]